jgi:Asp/Glu/hydantoin racemase
MKKQKLHWKENAIQKLGIEDSQRNVTAEHRQVLKIWENYNTEQYD